MNIITIKGVKDSCPVQIEGTSEWYYCFECKIDFGDLQDAYEMVQEGKVFPGKISHLIHYPEGTLYQPFQLEEYVYIDKPIWDNNNATFYFLGANFNVKTIQIYSYVPVNKTLALVQELPLDIVIDCYNLMLQVSPPTLYRDANNGVLEIVWPEKKEIKIGKTESLMFRDGDDLYLTEWIEDPDYYENVIVRDIHSGRIKDKYRGYLCKMPNGVYWQTIE